VTNKRKSVLNCLFLLQCYMWAARVSQKYSQSLQEVTNSDWMEGAARMFAELAALILHLNCS